MSSPLEKIKSLVPYLPKGDIKFANKFLAERNYESLKELTWSALERLNKAYKKDVLPEKYKDIDIDKVRELAMECWDYYYLLFPEELQEDNEHYDDDVEDD